MLGINMYANNGKIKVKARIAGADFMATEMAKPIRPIKVPLIKK